MAMYGILILAVIGLLTVASIAILVARVFRRTKPTFTEAVLALSMTGILAAIIIPNFVKARSSSCPSACMANLKQIQGAKAEWAIETHQTPTDTPADSDLFGPTVYIREKPSCPAGGTYFVGAVGEKVRCSLGGPGHSLD